MPELTMIKNIVSEYAEKYGADKVFFDAIQKDEVLLYERI